MHFDYFRLRRLAQSVVLGSHGILPVNFWKNGSCQMLKCISTAQARTKCGPRFWGATFSCIRKKWLFRNVEMHFNGAGPHKV